MLNAVPDPTPPCPTCPAPYQGVGACYSSVFGPCKDGRWHDTTCIVARTEMAEARWPCGALQYPSVVVNDPPPLRPTGDETTEQEKK